MEDVQVLLALVELGERIGKINQVHLYEGGLINLEGEGFSLSFGRLYPAPAGDERKISEKERAYGRAQDVCQDHH